MITLTIDNQKIQVPAGTTILNAARHLGIYIPTLCFAEGYKPSASCMVCVVQVEGFKSLMPACGTCVAENMVVVTLGDQIQKARKTAIELLLSEHVGDCIGPCTRGCPANMNIPLMIRQIARGEFRDAIQTVKKDIPFPAVLGRICSAPCEKVCRRKQADGAVSICLLKRFVADVDLESDKPYRPACRQTTGKKVAIVGAGPCGLSAAYYLKQAGIDCVVIDCHDKPGGSLRYGDVDRKVLPLEVVEMETEQIIGLGVEFRGNIQVGRTVSMNELKSQFDAVLLAVGKLNISDASNLEIETKDGKLQVDRLDYSTLQKGTFAAGGCIRSGNLCIRAVADGKEAAMAIQSHLLGRKALKKEYCHQMGRLDEQEMKIFLKQAASQRRIEPKSQLEGLTEVEARNESLRCLHCDCRKSDNCKLRDLAIDVGARRNVWQIQRNIFEQMAGHEKVIFEPGKCIKCGLCIQTVKKAGEPIGLSFEGRGFDMKVVVPFEKALAEGLVNVYRECVKTCPTGALSLKDMIE